jgi:copper chaperone
LINIRVYYVGSMINKRVELRIYGMSCDDCVLTIEGALRAINGVEDVVIDLRTGTGVVKIDDRDISPDDILKLPVFGKDSHYKALIRKIE